MQVAAVSRAIKRVAGQEVTSCFGALRASDINEKTPAELVTEADVQASELSPQSSNASEMYQWSVRRQPKQTAR